MGINLKNVKLLSFVDPEIWKTLVQKKNTFLSPSHSPSQLAQFVLRKMVITCNFINTVKTAYY